MFSHNGKISSRQVLILLILQMFNINMLIMPKVCTNNLGRDGYIAPILAIVIGIIYLWCITSLTAQFPHQTLAEISEAILPKWMAWILVIAFSIKLIISMGLELRMFSEMISEIMLPRTPISVIMIVMLLTVSYLVKSGNEATGKMGEVLIYFIVLPLVIAILLIIFNTDYKEVLPMFQMNFFEVWQGAYGASFMFIPLEVLLVLSGLMNNPHKVRRVGIIAIITVGILQAIITLLSITQIGLGETSTQLWPVIILMKSIGMNNTIIENQEVLMLIVWIFSVFMYISLNLYVVSLMGSRSCKFKRESVFVLPILPIILLVALFPKDLGSVYSYYLKFQYFYGIWFIVPIPLALLLIYKIRRNRYEEKL